MALTLPSSQVYQEEDILLEKAIAWLESHKRDGVKVIRICDRYNKGYSDLFICVKGWLVVAELKDDTGVASPHQLKFIDDIKQAGGIGGVCRSLRDIYDLVIQAYERV